MGLIVERDHAQPGADVAAPCAQPLIIPGYKACIETTEFVHDTPVRLRKVEVHVLEPKGVTGLDSALGLFRVLLDGKGEADHTPPSPLQQGSGQRAVHA